MNADFRISTTALNHPKLIKLKRRLGAEGVLALLTLWAWTAQERPTGCLHGMDEEDIAIAAGWTQNEKVFVSVLTNLRLLDEGEEWLEVHDWAEHNPWAAGAAARSEKARTAAQKKWRTVTPMLESQVASVEQCPNEQVASVEQCPNEQVASVEQCPNEQVASVEQCPTTTPFLSFLNTTTPNPSSSEQTEPPPAERGDVVCSGDEEIKNRDVPALEYPTSLGNYERQQAETLIKPCPAQAQALLDELAAAIRANKVKTSPIAYLRGLAKRARDGTFSPEAGVKIAQDRERRRAAEIAVREALSRPPAAPEPGSGRSQTRPGSVAEHIAALKASLKMKVSPAADQEPGRIAT